MHVQGAYAREALRHLKEYLPIMHKSLADQGTLKQYLEKIQEQVTDEVDEAMRRLKADTPLPPEKAKDHMEKVAWENWAIKTAKHLVKKELIYLEPEKFKTAQIVGNQ